MKKNPSYGLGSEKRPFLGNKESLSTPSINAYNPNIKLIEKNNSSWGFGSEKRHGPDKKTHELPGPGNYTLDSKAFDYKKPKFHLG